MELILPVLRELALAFVATLGFGMLFNVPRRALLACGLTGAIGRAVRVMVEGLGASEVGGTFLGAVAVALVGYLLARVYRVPRTIFTITGVIPMVPGVPAFSTMLQLTAGDIEKGIASAVQTALLTGALAMGLTTVRAISHVPLPHPRPLSRVLRDEAHGEREDGTQETGERSKAEQDR